MQRRILMAFCSFLLGGLLAGATVYTVLDHRHSRRSLIDSCEYKAEKVFDAVKAPAQLRTGRTDELIGNLETRVDKFLVGVPMASYDLSYAGLTERCQRAMVNAKIYRSRYSFPKTHIVPGEERLHETSVPRFLADVPLLPADHPWLPDAVRQVRQMAPVSETLNNDNY